MKKYNAIGRAIEVMKLCIHALDGGEINRPRINRIMEELKEHDLKQKEFEAAQLLRIAIVENRSGQWLVEVLRNDDNGFFRFNFPLDAGEFNIELPYERLAQLKSALDDVLWAKHKYIPIPDKNS